VRRLEGIEFRRESRPFSPHLTLARFKDGGSPADRERIASARLESAGECTIDHVTLYQSRLSPRGPTYTPLVVSPLAAPERTQ
jgi:RNA 2',3'-cyclic 3'-phosphodiesterase